MMSSFSTRTLCADATTWPTTKSSRYSSFFICEWLLGLKRRQQAGNVRPHRTPDQNENIDMRKNFAPSSATSGHIVEEYAGAIDAVSDHPARTRRPASGRMPVGAG